MFADDLINAIGGPDDDRHRGAFGLLAPMLQDAQRFDLASEVIRSAYTVVGSPIDAQLRALPLCRLPFTTTWFEWSGSALSQFWADVGTDKVGVLIRTDENLQSGEMTFTTRHRRACSIVPINVAFDWLGTSATSPDLSATRVKYESMTDQQWDEFIAANPLARISTRESLQADTGRFAFIQNSLMSNYLLAAGEGPHLKNIVNAAMDGIQGLPQLVRAVVMLLNSRNMTAAEPRPVSEKLNKARAKSGKQPLLDHTHIRIRLSRAMAARAGEAADSRSPTRLHLVRGHFKVRATGVYWWSPFARGDATTGAVRQTRKIKL
jgi:hypothetical protein